MAQKTICIVSQSDIRDGGSNTYEDAFKKLIKEYFNDEYEVLFLSTGKNIISKNEKSDHLSYKLNILRIILIKLLINSNSRFILSKIGLGKLKIEKKLLKLNVKLLIFTSPNLLSLGVYSIPFFSTVWDLGHRDLPNYPETSLNGKFEVREEYYSKTLPKSSGIYVDSDVTAKKIIHIYGIDPKKIFNLGFSWLLALRNQEKCKLDLIDEKDNFIIYPANFWYHKNHKFLVDVFNNPLLRKTKIKVVFTGIDKGSMASVKKLIEIYDLTDKFIFVGQISVENLNYLYDKSLGVVFPSALGPSNLPPLEGLLFQKIAIVSDKHTSSEFVNNNIIKLSTNNPALWAKEINKLLDRKSKGVSKISINLNATKKLVKMSLSQFFESSDSFLYE